MIFQLPNPIPYTVVDSEELQTTFDKYRIVPYYGTAESTSHRFLEVLKTLTDLSSTFKSTVRDLREYTFGRNVRVVGNAIPGLDIDSVDLEPEEQGEFVSFLSGLNLTLPSIMKAIKRADYFLLVSGNAYLRIKRVTVGDTVRYYLSVPHYKHVAYLVSEDPDEQFVIYSKFLDDHTKLMKYPPDILRVSTETGALNWATTEPGVEETIIHLKNPANADESDYYARPDILPAMPDLYVDHQIPNQSSKVAATDIITRVILAFEAEDPNNVGDSYEDEDGVSGSGKYYEDGTVAGRKLDNFERNMLVLKQLATNMGSHPSTLGPDYTASTLAGVEYPHGGNPPTPIELEVNKDVAYQKWQRQTASDYICAILGWSSTLLQIRDIKANIGGNVLADVFRVCNVRTIKPRQTYFQDVINNLVQQVLSRESGPADFANYGIQFPDVIAEEINKIDGIVDPSVSEDEIDDPIEGQTLEDE